VENFKYEVLKNNGQGEKMGGKLLEKSALTRVQVIIIAVIIIISIIAVAAYYIFSRAPEEEIRIGVIGPFTGPFSRTGEEMKRASLLAVKQVNEKGGINGKPVKVFFGDDESKPEVGASAAEKLIVRDKVHGIAGSYHSSVTLAVMDVIAEYKIPFVNTLSLSEEIPKKITSNYDKYKYAFHAYINSTGYALSERAFIEYLVQEGIFTPKSKTIAIICEDTDYGRSAGGAFKKFMTEIGWTIVSEEYYPYTVTDFYPSLTKIKTLNPDILYSAGGGAPAITFTKQLKEVNIKALILTESYTIFPEFFAAVGDAGIGIIDFIQTCEATPVGKNFTKAYIQEFNSYPTYTAGCQYDAVMILLDAMEKAHSTDPDKIVQELLKTDYEGFITTRIVFNPRSNEAIFGPGYCVAAACQFQQAGSSFGECMYTVWPVKEREIIKTWE